MHGSISALSEDTKSRIIGALIFGDSRNKQDKGQIPNFPKSKTKIICNLLDTICMGLQIIDLQHLQYVVDVAAGVAFLAGLLS